MKKLALTLAAFAIVGCVHAGGQVPPSPTPVVGWTWTASSNATSSYGYVLSVATVASQSSTCPATTGTTYKQVGSTSNNTLTFSDSGEIPGTFICAITQASLVVSGQTLYSQPSAPSAVFAVPPLPTAPGAPNANLTQAMLDKRPSAPEPTMALVGMGQPDRPVLRVLLAVR